jgi:DNA-directed RNA polymerase specialized sigma24 family protein
MYEASGRAWTDRELVLRMRRDDPVALDEFYRRFTPELWKKARLLGVQPALRDEVVFDTLGDAALHLMRDTVIVPAKLTGYLVNALRNHIRNARRAAKRRAHAGAVAVSLDGSREAVVREASSEAYIRASLGPAWEPPALPQALDRLARLLDEEMTADERRLVGWMQASVPYRLVGQWIGTTANAARLRAFRLRDRLIEVAWQYQGPWSAAERRQLHAFFRRCGRDAWAEAWLARTRESGSTGSDRPRAADPSSKEGP